MKDAVYLYGNVNTRLTLYIPFVTLNFLYNFSNSRAVLRLIITH